MQFRKQRIDTIPKCYAAQGFMVDGLPHLAFAGEGDGSLQVYSGEHFEHKQTIWEGGGGTMSIVPLEGKQGWFLASRGFYSMVEAQDSTIEMVRFDGRAYTHEPIAKLPYLHRFGIVRAANGVAYVVAATIAQHKQSKEDWSHAGKLYYAALPNAYEASFELTLTELPGDYHMNHGFAIGRHNGREAALIGCREGLYAVVPPETLTAEWEISQMLDFPISDVAAADIDGDGMDELALISPFHGNRYAIYKREGNGYREQYHYAVEQDFYHAVVGATLGGERLFLGAARRMAMQLFAVRWNPVQKVYVPLVVDEGVGPSNLSVLHSEHGDIVLSANREIAEAAIYICIP